MNYSKALSVSLKDQVRSRIGLLDYAPTPENEINQHDRFRELLTSRSQLCEIYTQYPNQIEAKIDERRYHSSIAKDFHNNYIRIRRLFETCTNPAYMKNTPAAWNLVTAYYTSFFCASEFLKLQGEHILFLTDDDIQLIKSISSTSTAHLEQGSYTSSISLDPLDGFTATIKKVNIRHHQYVWDSFKRILTSALRGIEELSQSDRLKILRTIGEKDKFIPRPSDIRNRWNYRDAHYFGPTGDAVASQYIKLIKSHESTSRWFQTSVSSNDNGQLACGLSFICHSLTEAIEKTKPLIIR